MCNSSGTGARRFAPLNESGVMRSVGDEHGEVCNFFDVLSFPTYTRYLFVLMKEFFNLVHRLLQFFHARGVADPHGSSTAKTTPRN